MASPEKPSLDVTLNSEVASGEKQILLMRELGNKEAALTLLYQKEHEIGEEIDSDTEKTKSGNIVKMGSIEYDISLTALCAVNDPAVRMINDCFRKRKKVELWSINLQHKHPSEANKYAAEYFETYITSKSKTAEVSEYVELELEFAVDMEGQEGWATVTLDQQGDAQYQFKDTVSYV